MIDLHCHILPGIDDGVRDTDEALDLAKLMVADGITACVATPHIYPGRYDNDRISIQRSHSEFQAVLEDEGIPLDLHMAAEVRLTSELLRWIPEGRIPFLGKWKGKEVILLELPDSHIPVGTDKFITWLTRQKIQPLIAHPERNKAIMQNLSKVELLMELECLLQITAASVIGVFGETVSKTAHALLQEDIVFAVATDAHNCRYRPPLLSEAYSIIAEQYGEDQADILCKTNPLKLLVYCDT